MIALEKTIKKLQEQIKKHRLKGLKEYPTRTIFIDPLLDALGWDVQEPDEVELEYSTIDGKAADYALKIEKKPVILLEAKPIIDALDDVKSITQVVGYATNAGIDWCVLTNGIQYKVYRSSEKVPAPDKLLFEISIDPEHTSKQSIEQMASHLSRLSKKSMTEGVLDKLGEEIFTTAKVRKALDRLFKEQDDSFMRVIRKALDDDRITPAQIKSALSRIWRVETPTKPAREFALAQTARRIGGSTPRGKSDYGEAHHTDGKPVEVIELYRALDRFCQDRAPGQVTRRHLANYIAWTLGKSVFCSAHILRGGLKMWLKIDRTSIPANVTYARDVSGIGHWGVGDVEFAINNMERLRESDRYIQASFDATIASVVQ